MNMDKAIEVSGSFIRETDNAVLFDGGFGEQWVPKRFCEYDPDNKCLIVEEWIAKDKGFI